MEILNQFIKFAAIGVIGTAAHYVLLISLVQFLSIDAIIASGAGFTLGAIINYYLNFHYTFQSTKLHTDALPKFFTVALIGLCINTILMSLLTGMNDIHYLLSQIIATGIVLIWNFIANKIWTFSHKFQASIPKEPE